MADVLHFPEPDEPDASWGRPDEQPVDWLRRSTLPRAKTLRDALNENLSHFEPKHAASLAKKLRADWKSHYFELLVGRWLQELGAVSVECEPLGSNGTKIDYLARWVDGAVCVEANSKRMNLHARPGVAYVDNSQQRIRLAYRDWRKRRQAAGASAPAILAIDGGLFGADQDDFGTALLGSTVDHLGFDHKLAGQSFQAHTGEFLGDAAGPWAGVLAFVEPGVFGAKEPVLYVSPHFTGHLPLAFLAVERRYLGELALDRGPDSPMSRIRFGVPLFDGPDDEEEPGSHA